MTDSWTEDDDGRTIDVGPVTVHDTDEPIDEVRQAFEEGTKGITGPPLQFHQEPHDKLLNDMQRREQLRAEELEHLTKLRDRVQRGIDHGDIDLESGTEMLLNISKARMALAGVGYYPGAW